MPQPHRPDPSEPLRTTYNCPKCSFPMLLAIIEPVGKDGHDRRIFECLICNHVETVEVKFR